MTAILEAQGVTKFFGGVTAVDHVDLAVERGTIHGLIGPNGSGKTTFLNLINGIYQIDKGKVLLFGKDTTILSADKIARLGVARTFQSVGLFPGLSVLENARSGSERFNLHGLRGALFRGAMANRAEETSLKEAMEAIQFVGLGDTGGQLAGSLPYGRQRLLELARALVMRPELLLLDEPVAGLPLSEVERLTHVIREIKRRGITVLLVEHNMEFTMGICDRVTTLNFGRKIAEGTPLEIQNNPVVLEAYLGSNLLASPLKHPSSSPGKTQSLLNLREVSAAYGEVQALRQVSLDVFAGEMVAILGPNGAGKSTTLRAISGLFPKLKGEIHFAGKPIHHLSPHRIASLGISHVPEGRKIFPGLTVYENLEVASTAASKNGYEFSKALEEVYGLFPALRERSRQLGWSLSGGEQQMLAIARGLISKPKILLLDEPSLGLAPKLVENLFAWIQRIHGQGTTILLVEQNLKTLKDICQRIYIMEKGAIVYEGTPAQLEAAEGIEERYLSVKV